MSNKRVFILYYFVLVLILVFHQSFNEPPLVMRLAFLAAIILPTFFYKEVYYPAAIIMFLTIGNYSFSSTLMPNMLHIYVLVTLLAIPFLLTSVGDLQVNSIPFFLFILPLYILVVNLLSTRGGSEKAMTDDFYCFFLLLIFLLITGNYIETALHQLPLCFAIATIALSFLFLTNRNSYVESYLGSELDRIGWGDANYFGMVLGLGTITGLVKLFGAKLRSISTIDNLIYLLAIVLSIPVLLLNASRGAILSVVVAFLILLLFSKLKPGYKILISLLAVTLLFFLYNHQYMDLLMYRLQEDGVTTGAGRTTVWQEKLKAFGQKGMLQWFFGCGYYGGATINGYFRGFHNDYLAFLVDYGIVGLALFFYMLSYPFKILPPNSSLLPIIFSMMSYLATCFLTLEPMTFGKVTYFAFYLYVLLLAKQEMILLRK